jgi:hypothetical protein
MADIRDFLESQGLSADEITALTGDAKTTKAMTAMLSKYEEGTTSLEAARGEREEAAKFWEEKVTPALATTDRRVAEAESEKARYKTYLQTLKSQGYDVPADLLTAPTATTSEQPRNTATGNYMTREDFERETRANAPTLVRLTALSNEYADLYKAPYLTSEEDFAEAQKQRQPFTDFVRNKYKFSDKKTERSQAELQTKMDAYAADKVAKEREEWVKANGGNDNLRSPLPSKFDKIEGLREKKDSWKSSAGRDEARKGRLTKFQNVVM